MSWNNDIFVVNQCRLCDWYQTTLDTINATNEKIVVNGYTPLSTTIRLYERYETDIEIHNTINNRIGNFANHQTNSGVYTGLAEIPVWNMADILTAIGDSERYEPRLGGSAKWSYQNYQILNLLRWRKSTVGLDSGSWKYKFGSISTNGVTTWPTSWTNGKPSSANENTRAYKEYYPAAIPPGWNTSLHRLAVNLTIPADPYNSGFTSDIDFYYASEKIGSWFGNVADEQYFNNEISQEDKLALIQTYSNQVYGDVPSYFMNEIASAPDEPPDPSDITKTSIKAWGRELMGSVHKYDGASGFTYKDW